MKKFSIWMHIDSGIERTIEAANEDEALKIFNETYGEDDEKQILANAQAGEVDILGVTE